MPKNKLRISCEANGNTASITIEGQISNWNNYASGFKSQINDLIQKGVVNAELYINSPGGDCFEANEISNAIRTFPGTITASLGALCASAATRISCECSNVVGAPNLSYMIHKPWTTVSGNSAEIEAQVKGLKNLEDEYAQAYSKKTGLSVDEIRAMWVEDYWMNAQEAKEKGFIDEIDGEEADITEEDVQAVSAYKKAPAIKATVRPQSTPTKPTDIMKDKLMLILATVPGIVINAATTEAELFACVETLKVKAAKADQLQKDYNALKDETQTKVINALLDSYEANKQTNATQRSYYAARLKENFEETKAHLDSLPKATQISQHLQKQTQTPTGSVDRSAWKYADYMEKDSHALAELAKNEPEKYRAMAKEHYGTDILAD